MLQDNIQIIRAVFGHFARRSHFNIAVMVLLYILAYIVAFQMVYNMSGAAFGQQVHLGVAMVFIGAFVGFAGFANLKRVGLVNKRIYLSCNKSLSVAKVGLLGNAYSVIKNLFTWDSFFYAAGAKQTVKQLVQGYPTNYLRYHISVFKNENHKNTQKNNEKSLAAGEPAKAANAKG